MASEVERAIEAIVMVSEEPMPPHLLAQILEVTPARVEELCGQLAESYVAEDRGFELVRVAGGYRFQSHADLSGYVERFALEGQSSRLSAAALETLALVAYKQPVSRAQVSEVRGVSVDSVMRTLQHRGYVAEIGRDPGPGQAVLYGTTTRFLEKLGIDSLQDLPPLAQFVPGPEVIEALDAGLRHGGKSGPGADHVDEQPSDRVASYAGRLSDERSIDDPPTPADEDLSGRTTVADPADTGDASDEPAPTEVGDTVAPTEVGDTVSPTDLSDSVDTADPAGATDPERPALTANRAGAHATADPADSAATTDPADSAATTDPADSAATTDPSDSAATTDPAGASGASDPETAGAGGAGANDHAGRGDPDESVFPFNATPFQYPSPLDELDDVSDDGLGGLDENFEWHDDFEPNDEAPVADDAVDLEDDVVEPPPDRAQWSPPGPADEDP